MRNCMDKFLKKYKPGENLQKPDAEILNFGRQMLPKEIVALWEDHGFGEYADGLIKVVDPRDYMNSLYSWLGRKDLSRIPIIVTAFGDIFYYRKLADNKNDVSLLNIKDTFGKNYDYDRFRQADRDVSELLGEPHPEEQRSVLHKLHRAQEQPAAEKQHHVHKNEQEL